MEQQQQNQQSENIQSATQDTISEDIAPDFDLKVTGDAMEARLRVTNAYAVKNITFEMVSTYLETCGIAYGICDDDIRCFCKSGQYSQQIVCARGLRCVNGKDGRLEYLVNTSQKIKPKEREDGTVDYRDLGLVQNVQKGTALCRCIPPEQGRDGIDVYNREVRHKPGLFPQFPSGVNTVISEDKLSLLAAVDGSLEYKNAQLNVNEMFTVRGDVDNVSGNVQAVGSVMVQGDVLEGFSVKADKDVTIRGMVEGAVIEAKGNIAISNGMNGMGRGILNADGNISARYFENTTINAQGDVLSDVMMNCRVKSQSSIVLKGKTASLIGGSYCAGSRIMARNIGNASHTKTEVMLSSSTLNNIYAAEKDSDNTDELKSKYSQLEKSRDDMQKKIDSINIVATCGRYTPKTIKSLKETANIKMKQICTAIEQLQKDIQAAEERNLQLPDFRIVVSGRVYPGVKIQIGPFKVNVLDEYSSVKIYGGEDGIVFAPAIPADFE